MSICQEPWYNTYGSMMTRCYNKNAANYYLYGGRGIKVCDEWHDAKVFGEWAIDSGFKKGLTIDRINVDGDYEPNNCRWATKKEQANNRRDTRYVTIDGITKTLTGWAEFSGINRNTLCRRYQQGIRGVMLLHRAEDTRFKDGYNKYADPKHYHDYAHVIIPAERSEDAQKAD
jgi:hypothetical protein